MSTIYLDRNNSIARQLTISGDVVEGGIITRAILVMPEADVDGSDVIFDTQTDNDIQLIENETVVFIEGGSRSIKEGFYNKCFLTCFDSGSPNGIAWDEFSIKVREWPIE